MPRKRPAVPSIPMIGLMIGVALVQTLVISKGSLSVALPWIAFFIGGGGMMVMFAQWRAQGDTFAMLGCLAAFGAWMLAVLVGSTEHRTTASSLSYRIAGLSLLIGFLGGAATLVRVYRKRRRSDESALPPSS